MAKRGKKQRSARMTRKYRSRVERERRQIRYIFIGTGAVIVVSVLVLLFGLYQTQVVNPQATRQAKEALKSIPAVTVNGEMVSIADWQARVRLRRLTYLDQAARIDQQLSLFDPSTEFGQQLIDQGRAQIEEIRNLLQLGDGIARDVLDQMLEEKLIRQEAARRGIVVSPEELQKYIEVSIFSYPYSPTPEPIPTLPTPTLAPTTTVAPQPTVTPTVTPTPRSREAFESEYTQYTQQIQEITEMSEGAWRAMIEGGLYRERLQQAIGAEVETSVQQVKGDYISAQDEETAQAVLARLEAGETFEALVEEVQADESEAPPARASSFDWLTLGMIQERFGDDFSTIAANTEAGRYASQVITAFDGRFYLLFVEGNEVRELADSLLEEQRRTFFEGWLEQQKQQLTDSGDIVFGDWGSYIPQEPSF